LPVKATYLSVGTTLGSEVPFTGGCLSEHSRIG
jgi:hypothetical protein